jgi:hypothetical protein
VTLTAGETIFTGMSLRGRTMPEAIFNKDLIYHKNKHRTYYFDLSEIRRLLRRATYALLAMTK